MKNELNPFLPVQYQEKNDKTHVGVADSLEEKAKKNLYHNENNISRNFNFVIAVVTSLIAAIIFLFAVFFLHKKIQSKKEGSLNKLKCLTGNISQLIIQLLKNS